MGAREQRNTAQMGLAGPDKVPMAPLPISSHVQRVSATAIDSMSSGQLPWTEESKDRRHVHQERNKNDEFGSDDCIAQALSAPPL